MASFDVYQPSMLMFTHTAMQLIVIVALSLNGANLAGYSKCDKDQKKRMTDVGASVANSVLSRAAGLCVTSAPSMHNS